MRMYGRHVRRLACALLQARATCVFKMLLHFSQKPIELFSYSAGAEIKLEPKQNWFRNKTGSEINRQQNEFGRTLIFLVNKQ